MTLGASFPRLFLCLDSTLQDELISITSRSDTLDEIESAGPAGAGATTKMAASAEMHAGTGRI
jgi:hypothetical protein